MGLFAALFLIVIGVTGSALVFEAEIDRALNPATSYVTPRERTLPLETLIARAPAAAPADVVTGIRIAERRDVAYEALLESGQLAMVDPYTGTVLGVRDRDTSLARRLHLCVERSRRFDRFMAGRRERGRAQPLTKRPSRRSSR